MFQPMKPGPMRKTDLDCDIVVFLRRAWMKDIVVEDNVDVLQARRAYTA
jgi:hypothetical protein